MTDVLAYMKDAGHERRYYSPNYETLLEATGLKVLECEYFGYYHGDALAIVSDGERKGISVWGYGSCSGCDALEAETPLNENGDWSGVNALADEMRQGVRWPEEGETVHDVARRMASKERTHDWYVYDNEMRTWLENFAERI